MVRPIKFRLTAKANIWFRLCLIRCTERNWRLFQDSCYESLSESWIHFLSTIDKDILIRRFKCIVLWRVNLLVLPYNVIPWLFPTDVGRWSSQVGMRLIGGVSQLIRRGLLRILCTLLNDCRVLCMSLLHDSV